MNPYESSIHTSEPELRIANTFGIASRCVGYVCLTPAILFTFLFFIGSVAAVFDEGFANSSRMLWPMAMYASLIVFVVSSAMWSHDALRLLMYISGAATVFCAIIYDTQNMAELDSYGGRCGYAVTAAMLIRFVCYSILVGVPLIAIAGLFGLESELHCNPSAVTVPDGHFQSPMLADSPATESERL